MAEETGALIKEARTAADMTQKELAEAVDGLSAKSISEAERGLRELTDEQLAAIAEATGSESLLIDADEDEPKDESPEVPAEAAAMPAADEKGILEMFNAADPAVKQAALSVLKGVAPQGKSFLDSVLPMVGEILGGKKVDNPLPAIMGFLASEEGTAFLGTIQGALGNVAGMFSRNSTTDGAEQNRGKSHKSLLIFTFAYAVAIYVLLLSFYFWLTRTDIKPEV